MTKRMALVSPDSVINQSIGSKENLADDEEEEKGDDAYTHRSSRAAEDTQKSGVNPVYNAVHELISEVAL